MAAQSRPRVCSAREAPSPSRSPEHLSHQRRSQRQRDLLRISALARTAPGGYARDRLSPSQAHQCRACCPEGTRATDVHPRRYVVRGSPSHRQSHVASVRLDYGGQSLCTLVFPPGMPTPCPLPTREGVSLRLPSPLQEGVGGGADGENAYALNMADLRHPCCYIADAVHYGRCATLHNR